MQRQDPEYADIERERGNRVHTVERCTFEKKLVLSGQQQYLVIPVPANSVDHVLGADQELLN